MYKLCLFFGIIVFMTLQSFLHFCCCLSRDDVISETATCGKKGVPAGRHIRTVPSAHRAIVIESTS